MYFKSSIRTNPETNEMDGYYRLIESYRNIEGRVCHRTLLNVGFLSAVSVDQLNKIQSHLNERYKKQETLFEEVDSVVTTMTERLWHRLVSEKRIDINWIDKAERQIDVDTIKHSNVREVGTEWMCYNTWNQLQLTEFLHAQGWSQTQIALAATQVISRAAYPASELKTSQWIKENSAVCELTGYNNEHITKDKLYQSALNLYNIKTPLENHLSARTNDMFDLQDKIILYDLTNTYFEGRKVNSAMAKFGKSKEKRYDAKLLVLAMVVNIEGFIKYTAIHEGNIADCQTLSTMIDKLALQTNHQKPIIVLDAGIATEKNLALIQAKGYRYVCVSRTKIKDYTIVSDKLDVIVETKTKKVISLKAIQTKVNTDYYLEVTSPAKAMKEQGMKNLFETRFEESLEKIKSAVHKKSGVKTVSKVHERIGRAKEKYPSIHHYYNIDITADKANETVTNFTWTKNQELSKQKESELGVYFLRTNMAINEEVIVWDIYNTIREIESAFRTLKTDLDLRPIYHKNDDSSMAHLHLGILAYWLVNTIRHQLKSQQIKHSWKEIVRIGNTQKMITTSGQNTFDKTIYVRKCSEPNQNLKQLFDALKVKHKPFKKLKSVVHKKPPTKTKPPFRN